MQPTGTVWTSVVEDHPGIIPVKFGQNPIVVSEKLFKEIVDGCMDDRRRTMGHHKSLTWALYAQVN